MAEIIKSNFHPEEEERAEAVKEVIGQAFKPDAITREQFNEAYMQVIDEMMNDPQLTGMKKLIVPLTGSVFAYKMEVILFGEEKEER